MILRVKVVRRTKPSNSSKPRTVRQMSDEFVPAAPGTWTVIARREANHEAAHALIAVLMGIRVYEARIDNPDLNVLGHVAFDKEGTELWMAMCVSLAPLVFEGRCPSWPLDLMTDDGDEFRAAVRAYDAGLTQNHYYGCVTLIEYLFDKPSSKRALTRLSGALLERGALDGAAVRAIVEAEATKAGFR
jgi:hypothetical protein